MSVPSSQPLTFTQIQLDAWVEKARTQSQYGQLPNYIPRLAEANPNWFAAQIRWANGQVYTSGDVTQSFPLMSVVKPFVLLFLLEQLGTQAVFRHVGRKPSREPFNSLLQLEADAGWPRNPMLNSGAIVLASLLPGQDPQTRCSSLCQWLNQKLNCHLFLDQSMLNSVRSVPNERNQAIAMRLAESGYLDAVETALDTYNHICCLSGTVTNLASLGMRLAHDQAEILPEHRQIVLSLMTTCGLYQASKDFAVQLGLPTKSGVSGAIVAVVPSQGAIACYSPPLDQVGNSVSGLFLLRQIIQTLPIKPGKL